MEAMETPLQAIAFDFDGTLIHNGIDKVPYGMYSAYVACHETAFWPFLSALPRAEIIERLRQGIMSYPGAPRFQQLAAMVSAVVTGRAQAFDDPVRLGLDARMVVEYSEVKSRFSALYSALNDEANAHYWRPFPSVPVTLAALAEKAVLFIASGVPQAMLDRDLLRHGFDRTVFHSIFGADRNGQDDKQALLERIKAGGYRRILFVGDSHKDQYYAAQAGVSFYRISTDDDFPRLLCEVQEGRWPDQREEWTWTLEDIAFARNKALRLIEKYAGGHPLSIREASRWVCA